MPDKYTVDILSVEDVIHTFNEYETTAEAKEHILFFVSALVGISVDEIITSYADV